MKHQLEKLLQQQRSGAASLAVMQQQAEVSEPSPATSNRSARAMLSFAM